jgi:hypothetical protein
MLCRATWRGVARARRTALRYTGDTVWDCAVRIGTVAIGTVELGTGLENAVELDTLRSDVRGVSRSGVCTIDLGASAPRTLCI